MFGAHNRLNLGLLEIADLSRKNSLAQSSVQCLMVLPPKDWGCGKPLMANPSHRATAHRPLHRPADSRPLRFTRWSGLTSLLCGCTETAAAPHGEVLTNCGRVGMAEVGMGFSPPKRRGAARLERNTVETVFPNPPRWPLEDVYVQKPNNRLVQSLDPTTHGWQEWPIRQFYTNEQTRLRLRWRRCGPFCRFQLSEPF